MAVAIFDMDDTLVSTAALWRRAEEQLLAFVGAKWSEELARQYKGMNALDVAATVHRALQPKGISVEECQRVMRDALLGEFATELPEAMPGAVACVKRMAGRKVALVSGSPMEAIESVLTQLEILPVFSVVISSESVAHGKPHPAVYLLAAQKLEVKPAECVAFEDSVVGVQAATSAGMKCIAVPSGAAAVAPIRELGARVVESLEEVGWEDVERMVEK